jgi:subtilisin family serine protease
MKKYSSARTLIALLLALVLLTCQPLLVGFAQSGDDLQTASPSPMAETEPVDPTLTVEVPTSEGSPTAEMSETPTSEITTPTLTETPTVTSTAIVTQPVPTATPKPVKTAVCTLTNVYENQLMVVYAGQNIPGLAANLTLVDSYLNGEGNRVAVVQVSGQSICAAWADLEAQAQVVSVEPNYALSTLDTMPNDPYVLAQYYLDNILAPQGWEVSTGSAALTIAIIDSGIEATHPDLASKVVAGYDFIDNDTTPQDDNGHGTLVAGIAAASSNNGTGIAGVSWGARIMPLRVLDYAGNGSYANTAAAILWATDHGARVINLSLGGKNYSEVLEDAVNYALNQGVVVVAASGNSGANALLYPAAYAGVVGVGATDSGNHLASFSNTGAGIDVVAPGVSILSTSPGNNYRYDNGTSFSAPQVAGFAALLFSMPSMQYSSDVVNLIHTSALDLGASGYDTSYGYGLIQIGPAMMQALGKVTPTATMRNATSIHAVSQTPTPTSTAVAYWPVRSLTPTMAIKDAPPTATPGEVSMQELPTTGPTHLASEIPPVQNTVTPVVSIPEKNTHSGQGLWMILALLCFAGSVTIFLAYKRRAVR